MVERVNNIFTSVDWGLSPDNKRFVNMGFVIKEMKIMDRPTPTPDHYNAEFSDRANGQFSAVEMLQVYSTF